MHIINGGVWADEGKAGRRAEKCLQALSVRRAARLLGFIMDVDASQSKADQAERVGSKFACPSCRPVCVPQTPGSMSTTQLRIAPADWIGRRESLPQLDYRSKKVKDALGISSEMVSS
jgi:hypothetical protein